jgi:hypothetical protein
MSERKDLWWVLPVSAALLVLITASTAANFIYGMDFGGPVIGGVSVASDLIKVVALIGVFSLWRNGHWFQGGALLLLFIGFTVWSMISAVGFISSKFSTLQDTRGKAASEWQELTAEITRLKAQREQVLDVRPMKTIQADIDALLRIPGINGCVKIDGPVTEQHCPTFGKLEAEIGHAERAMWLDGQLALKREELKKTDRVTVVDPRTNSLSAVSGVDDGSIVLFVKIFIALLVEAATAFGLWAVWSPFFARRHVAASRMPAPIIPRKPYTPSLTLPVKPVTPTVTETPEPPASTPGPDDSGTPISEPETKPDDTVQPENNVVTLYDPPVNKRDEKRRKKEIIDRQNRALVSSYVDERLDTASPSAEINLTSKGGWKAGGTPGDVIYTDFRRWCRDSNHHAVGRSHFGRFIGEFVDRARNSKGVVYGAVIRSAIAKRKAA